MVKDKWIWTEKYSPQNMDEFLGSDNDFVKRKFNEYIEQGEIPLLLLEGSPGTGKSTLANIITQNIDCEIKHVNASDERGMPLVRDIIKPFVQTSTMKKWKIVWLEEGDKLTPDAQDALKDIMLRYIKKCRFIVTCNNKNLLNDALQSRFSAGSFEVKPLNKKDVMFYLIDILKKENVTYENKDVAYLINKTYPDIRKAINNTQQYVNKDNVLQLDKSSVGEINLMNNIIESLSTKGNFNKTYTQIRQNINDNKLNVYQPVISHIYENLDKITTDGMMQATLIMVLNEAQKSDKIVVDKEINVMNMFSELLQALNS